MQRKCQFKDPQAFPRAGLDSGHSPNIQSEPFSLDTRPKSEHSVGRTRVLRGLGVIDPADAQGNDGFRAEKACFRPVFDAEPGLEDVPEVPDLRISEKRHGISLP